jgi:hypothetical protein
MISAFSIFVIILGLLSLIASAIRWITDQDGLVIFFIGMGLVFISSGALMIDADREEALESRCAECEYCQGVEL